MADIRPSREDGHLVVAAIRILRYRQGNPPTPAEIGEMLDWGDEQTHVALRGLVDAEILRMHKTPFDVHYEIGDHHKVDSLTPEAEREALQDEVKDFQRRSASRHKELEALLNSDTLEKQKKEKLKSLEEQFADFKKKKPGPPL